MEKKDKIDEFMELHRDQFDMYDPPEDLWNKISPELDQHDRPADIESQPARKSKLVVYSMRVAAVVTIFFASYLFHRVVDKTEPSTSIATTQDDSAAQQDAAEFQEAETFYVVQVNNKMKDLERYSRDYPEIMSEIQDEMKSLDSEYRKLQKDLKEGIASQEIINAMIQNYRLKLEILEKMNEVITKQESQKKTRSHDI